MGAEVDDGAPKENDGASFLAGVAVDPKENPLDVALDDGVDEVSRPRFNFGIGAETGVASFAGAGAPNENDGFGASDAVGLVAAGAPNENVGASFFVSVDDG